MKNGVPTLDDVAKQVGVSKSTVSRILNNRLGNGFSVKEEVRLKVIEVAKKLNYRPNLIAKSLTMQSTQMIHIFSEPKSTNVKPGLITLLAYSSQKHITLNFSGTAICNE